MQLEDCNGNTVTFTLTGGGEGDVVNDCNFNNIILSGTTEKSVLSITTVGGARTSIGNIDANGPINSIIGRNVDLNGDITIDGSAAMIVMGDVPGDSNITIGSPASPKTTCALRFGEVNNVTLTSGTPIKELRATEWRSGSVNAPWISSLATDGNATGGIAGDFDANMTLSGEGSPKDMVLNKTNIAGGLGGTTWDINGNCGTIEIAESNADFNADIAGNVGTLKAVGNKKMNIPPVLSGIWSFKSVKTIGAAEISECNITATQEANMPAIGKMTVTGWISNCDIETTGDVSSITSGGIRNSLIGVNYRQLGIQTEFAEESADKRYKWRSVLPHKQQYNSGTHRQCVSGISEDIQLQHTFRADGRFNRYADDKRPGLDENLAKP